MGLFRSLNASTAAAADRAGKLLAWDETGTKIISVSPENATAVIQQVVLSVTAEIPKGVVLDVSASGTGYTVSGDSVNLGGSEGEFQSDADLEINLNGLEADRGTGVMWMSPTSLYFPDKILRPGEAVVITQRTG